MSTMNYNLYKASLERSKATWNDCVAVVAKFQTFQQFQSAYPGILPSLLKIDFDYQLFKEGFRPDWYDPVNKNGGRYVFQNLEQINDEDFNQLWLDVVDFVMSSESLPGGSGVVGALVKVRGLNGYKRTISIWMSSESTEMTQKLVADKLKEKLKMDRIFFSSHADLERRSMLKKARRMEQLTMSAPQVFEPAKHQPLSWRDRPKKPSDEVKSWRRAE